MREHRSGVAAPGLGGYAPQEHFDFRVLYAGLPLYFDFRQEILEGIRCS
jgi:hypothetical protein